MADESRDRFLRALDASLRDESLVKLTLGAPCGPDPTLRKIRARVVSLRAGPHLQLVWRHDTKDLTRNVGLRDAVQEVETLLGTSFASAHLFTTERTWQLDRKKKGWRLSRSKPVAAAADPAHDRAKQRVMELDPRWLTELGVLDARGKVRRGMQAKHRQILQFVDILSHTLDRMPELESLRVVDMGCGKGLLTFAAWQLLTERGLAATVTGVELRPELAAASDAIARSLGFAGLRFVAGSIESAPLDGVDLVIALHACNTATDDALARGVQAGARVLLAAPCCHQEVRPQLTAPEGQAALQRHGILRTRQAELVTDALRAALLESAGYRARVIEFVSAEHTDKNLMIVAERGDRPAGSSDRAQALARSWGIRTQRLAERLGVALAG